MKTLKFLVIILPLLLISCTKILPDDENYKYEFKDQQLKGKIMGEPFAFESGIGKKGISVLTATLYDITVTNTTKETELAETQLRVNIVVPVSPEVHYISDWDTHVTFTGEGLDGEYHADSGAIQITEIIVGVSAAGQLDVIMGNDTLNGRFSISLK